MNILNGSEAFAAMVAGQKIECRHIESDRDFDEIANHPATIFIDPAFEFRIAVILKMIGLMQVPVSIMEAPAKGTQCFVPNVLTEKLVNAFKWKNSDSDLALLQRGQVHLYEQHATIHAEALIKISGGTLINEVELDADLPFDIVDKVETAVIDKPQAISIPEQTNVTISEDNLSPVLNDQREIEANYQMTLDALDTCVNEQEVDVISDIKNMQFSVEQIENIEKARDLKLIALRTSDLVDQANKASTPTEANALVRYTKSWTEEQRKPVMTAINKRLVELDVISPASKMEYPSLMVRIQKAIDIAELYELEAEVRTRHPDIQPKLMDIAKQRRFELENQAAQAEVTS